jgi:hypothetical protein
LSSFLGSSKNTSFTSGGNFGGRANFGGSAPTTGRDMQKTTTASRTTRRFSVLNGMEFIAIELSTGAPAPATGSGLAGPAPPVLIWAVVNDAI